MGRPGRRGGRRDLSGLPDRNGTPDRPPGLRSRRPDRRRGRVTGRAADLRSPRRRAIPGPGVAGPPAPSEPARPEGPSTVRLAPVAVGRRPGLLVPPRGHAVGPGVRRTVPPRPGRRLARGPAVDLRDSIRRRTPGGVRPG